MPRLAIKKFTTVSKTYERKVRTSKKTSRVTGGDSSKGTSSHDTDSKLIKYEIVSESNQPKSTTVCCIDISTTRN